MQIHELKAAARATLHQRVPLKPEHRREMAERIAAHRRRHGCGPQGISNPKRASDPAVVHPLASDGNVAELYLRLPEAN
jgi:hypothetical protein